MDKLRPVKLFSATRLPEQAFIKNSFLGRSLSAFPKQLAPAINIKFDNTGVNALGLSEYYNRCLDSCEPGDIALLIHDDVYVHSWFLADQLREAICHFDIVGLIGNATPDFRQPSWALAFHSNLEPAGWQQNAVLSGCISHYTPETPYIGYYGNTPASCKLLDGLFLAVDTEKVNRQQLRFDPQFRFHCYDIDFCRAAAQAGLGIGTWGIPATHASGGAFKSEEWKESARRYLEKWKNPAAAP